MKKIILSLIVTFGLLTFIPTSAKSEPIPVYMFSKDGCSGCVQAEEYFDELLEDNKDLFVIHNIVVFDESWQIVDDARANLLMKVYEEFGRDSNKAMTPTIIIGDKLFIGIEEKEDIEKTLKELKDSKKRPDTAKEIIEDLKLNLEELEKYEKQPSMPTIEDEVKTAGGKYDTLIIVSIFVILIGGFAALVVFSKK